MGGGVEGRVGLATARERPEAPETRFTEPEERLLSRVEDALAIGLELESWWCRVSKGEAGVESFDLISQFNRPARSFEFFGTAPTRAGALPVMGNFQEMVYDHSKARPDRRRAAAEWMQEQVREFVLHYFMRVSDFRQPSVKVNHDRSPLAAPLSALSWCPEAEIGRGGFGFTQLFYKSADGGGIARFPTPERHAVVDLREVGTSYEWIVTRVRIFDFDVNVRPLGRDGPTVRIPLREDSYLVTNRDLVVDEDRPEPGILGRYGFGYAFISDPSSEDLLAYGPSQLQPAFQTIELIVAEDGRVSMRMAFAAQRPQRILNLNLDPVDWSLRALEAATLGLARPWVGPLKRALDQLPLPEGAVDPVFGSVDLINLLTGGLAARELCISRDQLEKDFLVQHFKQHYEMAVGSLLTWRQIPDWLDAAALPAWVKTGVSS